MKKWWLLCFIVFPIIIKGQTITLVAGGGSGGDGSPATTASIFCPEYMVFDMQGNLYFTEALGHRIRKISTSGIITTIGGIGSQGFSGDGGPATAAKMKFPIGIATDVNGNIYFSDNENHRIRRIDAVTNFISTIAGTGIGGYNGDGIPASDAQLNYPQGINIDKAGNIYISDNTNFRLRKINLSGIISTVAGTGSSISSGDGGPASAAACGPWNVGFDGSGNIYISDGASYTIRKINAAGIISTVAGKNGLYVYDGDGISATNAAIAPAFITVDASGVIYVPDGYNDRIRRVNTSGIIETVAGDGMPGFSGDGGPATASKINNPSCVILDTCNNLFFAQIDNPRIRKIEFNPGCIPISIQSVKSPEVKINVYPNPANTQLSIASPEAIKSVILMNTLGQSIDQFTFKENKNEVVVNIRHLPPGIYVVQLTDMDGQKRISKFVKE